MSAPETALVVDPAGLIDSVSRASVAARLVAKLRPDSAGCWIFTGASRGVGYGAMQLRGRVLDAHRLAFLLFVGDVPSGHFVCHTCDVRACCNPAHLFAGTPKANFEDGVRKGRLAPRPTGGHALRGEANAHAKLTDAQVVAIREARAGGASFRAIARDFGISRAHAFRLATGATRLEAA